MDLVQTVRKEGSRGGRADFRWEDVKNDSHRENYLGHSLMAPVGRWQKNRDLNWYAKGDADSDQTEADRIKEEKRRIKEAEEDAMLAAMGLPVPVRASANANLTPLGEKVQEADVKEAVDAKVNVEGKMVEGIGRKSEESTRTPRDGIAGTEISTGTGTGMTRRGSGDDIGQEADHRTEETDEGNAHDRDRENETIGATGTGIETTIATDTTREAATGNPEQTDTIDIPSASQRMTHRDRGHAQEIDSGIADAGVARHTRW
ncbi:hypothetical protein K491DRAFT_774934 [Lophiostoma macrostomum CBS 122681]|uniref:Multiple myeloma tumor-associated protein 2-like N-terminal domain-containing protein n=1 Tax=Lophiostoma macrostomum CBS 122681 TaxID=1314788 RepID=A0A6A6TJH4_9PLEO|nr:hypothetical protein K491DRAFT_774934 [Lophiostoma macrostomum CBS 122681]